MVWGLPQVRRFLRLGSPQCFLAASASSRTRKTEWQRSRAGKNSPEKVTVWSCDLSSFSSSLLHCSFAAASGGGLPGLPSFTQAAQNLTGSMSSSGQLRTSPHIIRGVPGEAQGIVSLMQGLTLFAASSSSPPSLGGTAPSWSLPLFHTQCSV